MEIWHLIEVLGAGIVTVLAWIGRTQVSRINQLERDKADRESVQQLRDTMDQVAERMDTQHASISSRLDNLLLAITRQGHEK